MHLKKVKSNKVIRGNIKKLMKKSGSSRKKAVNTIAKKQGITTEQAQQKQAVAIALSKAKKIKK